MEASPVAVEITYGIERLASYIRTKKMSLISHGWMAFYMEIFSNSRNMSIPNMLSK
ncbi:hypothetical protein [Sinobaca sp. H24]|uniref:hypothetical protein n=1 Tax=Sinobaca sp. H24 TaxID=2923376 RepID=UPI0035B34A93